MEEEKKTEIMGKQESTTETGNNNGQSPQETQQTSPIPHVPREDLSTFEKGDTIEYDTKENKH